ncbi:MAG: hypothetical protein PF541_10700 [Prolixibacteraceae bacterium]|jgi:hypothetical protein|nr:hypothetical protein [Prolixibacteraceae bacterium]
MEKLLNDQMLEVDVMQNTGQQIELLQDNVLSMQNKESEIENGNVQDYLEIYGEL